MKLSATYDRILPDTRAEVLAGTVGNDTSLKNATKTQAASQLNSGRANMTQRNFNRAASDFGNAESTLTAASADPGYVNMANWIGAHCAWLAAN